MSKLQYFLIVLLLSLVVAPWATAVEKVDLRDAIYILDQLRQARFVESNHAFLHNVLRLDQGTKLELLRKRDDGRGLVHSRYLLVYNGVPVWGEQVIISENEGREAVRLHGVAVVGIERDLESVEPAFDSLTALEMMKARQRDNAKVRGNWRYENESSKLVVFVHEDKATLCYAVTFFAELENQGEPTRPTYIVDAGSKEILLQFEGLTTDEGTGPGGNTKTGQYEYGTDYPAFDVQYANGRSTMQCTNVVTVNLNHGSSGSTPYSYEGKRNTVKTINGAFSPLNDAHFFGNVVFNMYNDWYKTAPLTFRLTMRVHYGNSYENAFWNGSSMTFGDGKTRFFPLVSLDVSAHEVSHGFTEQNSGLIYSGQSGGINESFSDMAGEASEYFMKNKNDWMVGAEIFKQTGALRYLNDPPKDGRSIGSAKDYKSGMDVHYSSGVYNKAFYLLGTTQGWNTRMAFDVFVKANRDYWTGSTDFVKGAKAAMDAAKDLGYSTDAVIAAFKGVDIEIK